MKEKDEEKIRTMREEEEEEEEKGDKYKGGKKVLI